MSLESYAQVTIDNGPTRNLLVKQLSAATKARYKHEFKKVWLDSGQQRPTQTKSLCGMNCGVLSAWAAEISA
jgi:hypothetical protein